MVAFWLIFIGTAGTLERQHLARTAKAAENVMVGNSEKEVLELLGQPNERKSWGHPFLLVSVLPTCGLTIWQAPVFFGGK